MSGSGTSSLPQSEHFSQAESKMVKADRAAAHKVDLSKLKKHKDISNQHELQEVRSSLSSLCNIPCTLNANMLTARRFPY